MNNVIDSYNLVAEQYACTYYHELEGKRFDKLLLQEFVQENMNKGTMLDVGCGPGQITRFLRDAGQQELLGIDISTEMVRQAHRLNPDITFLTGDILALATPDCSIRAVTAMYAIVHFQYQQVEQAFREIYRILHEDGQFLCAFHIGKESIVAQNFLNSSTSLEFFFFEPEKIQAILANIGFKLIEAIERMPYHDREYPSKRAYIWVQK